VTHPADSSTIQYFYTDPTTGYFLDHVTDELFHTTSFVRDPTSHRKTKTTYPDGGFELYGPFNSFGQPLTYQNTSGGVYQYTYDRGLLYSVTAPDPNVINVTNYGYDANDHLQVVVGPRATSYCTYDALGRLTVLQHPYPNSSTINYVYNTDSTLRSVTDELNHITSFTYDDYKRLASVTTPQRGNGDLRTISTRFWYDTNGNGTSDYSHTFSTPTRTALPSLKVVKAAYDANHRKTSVITGFGTADAATTSFAYDPVGNLTTVTEPNGQAGGINSGAHWTYNYDARNRLISYDDPIPADRNSTYAHTFDWFYDAGSRVYMTVGANDQVTTVDSFDLMNRVLQTTTQQSPSPNAVTKYSYYGPGDPNGGCGFLKTFQDAKLSSGTDAYTYVYDKMGRLTSKQYPLDTYGVHRTEGYTYDAAGNVATYTNRAGNVLTLTYDERDQLIYKHWNDSLTPDVGLGYDTASRLTGITNGNAGEALAYYNDNLLYTDGVSVMGDPGRTVTYTYDWDGNRSTIAYPGGTPVFTYAYTNRNQLDNIHDASAQWVKYVYDPSGNRQYRRTTNSPGNPQTLYFPVDALNRPPTLSTGFNVGGSQTFNYAFDSVGRLKYEQRNGGTADGYTYDLADQIVGFNRDGALAGGTVTGGSEVETLNFDANGNRLQTVDNGVTKNYVTDPLNQYSTDLNGAATYDTKGNLATTGDGWVYTYDAQNRLWLADKSSTNTHVVYYYDGMSRQVARDEITAITTLPVPNNTLIGMQANANNLYVTAENAGNSPLIANRTAIGGWEQFRVEDQGNGYFALKALANGLYVTAENAGASPLIANRPTVGVWEQFQIVSAGSGKVALIARANGKYVTAENAGASSLIANRTAIGAWEQFTLLSLNFTYSVWDGWSLVQEYNSSWTLLNNYLHGNGVDEMVARFGTNNANRIWYYQDGRGNTSHLANDGGALVESYKYDLGGKPFFFNGSGGSILASAYSNRFLYNGRDYSSLTNMYDFRNRFYRPDTSRFLQPDPIGFGGGNNMYRFAGNSAVNAMDPLGLQNVVLLQKDGEGMTEHPYPEGADSSFPGGTTAGGSPGGSASGSPDGGNPFAGSTAGGTGLGGSGIGGPWGISTGGSDTSIGVNFGGLAGTGINVGAPVVGGGGGGGGGGAITRTIVINLTTVIFAGSQSGTKTIHNVTLYPDRNLIVSPPYGGSTFVGVGNVGVRVPGDIRTRTSVTGAYPNFTVNMQATAYSLPLNIGVGLAIPPSVFFVPLLNIQYNLSTSVSFENPLASVSGSHSAYPSIIETVNGDLVYAHYERFGLFGILPGVSVNVPPGN
jgi:RHS repeat-associated protein